jgi:hypothetical protein
MLHRPVRELGIGTIHTLKCLSVMKLSEMGGKLVGAVDDGAVDGFSGPRCHGGDSSDPI